MNDDIARLIEDSLVRPFMHRSPDRYESWLLGLLAAWEVSEPGSAPGSDRRWFKHWVNECRSQGCGSGETLATLDGAEREHPGRTLQAAALKRIAEGMRRIFDALKEDCRTDTAQVGLAVQDDMEPYVLGLPHPLRARRSPPSSVHHEELALDKFEHVLLEL